MTAAQMWAQFQQLQPQAVEYDAFCFGCDADALAAKCDEPYWCVWLSDIESAPTIIEAN